MCANSYLLCNGIFKGNFPTANCDHFWQNNKPLCLNNLHMWKLYHMLVK